MIQNKKMNKRIISLMRTTKTTALFTKLDEAGLLYIYPAYGKVTVSFASWENIVLAEPHTMIRFAGQMVIKHTISEKLLIKIW